ncbi:cytoskeletal protein RodZ [Rhodanobacter sp. TND4EL1]
MKTTRQPLILAVSLAAALALGGCGKKDDSASQIPATPPPEAAAPATPPTTMAPTAPEAGASMVTVSSVQLGSKVDENNKIAASGDSFAPKDSIYASVDTTGTGNGTLAANWTYQDGQTVHEDSKMLTTNGPQTTVFMISKPSGFPAGNYKVDISLDGKQVASKDFSVK